LHFHFLGPDGTDLNNLTLQEFNGFLRNGFSDVVLVVSFAHDSIQGLKTIPPQIDGFVKLTTLRIQWNLLTSLSTPLFHLKNLRILDLSGNKLVEIDERIDQLSMLTQLILSNNILKLLPSSMGKLNKLEILALSSNQLKAIPITFGRLKSLRVLLLNENRLKDLDISLIRLPRLFKLELNGNEFTNDIFSSSLSEIKQYFQNSFVEEKKLQVKKYDYANKMRLGKGSFGVVFKAKKGDQYYAVKCLDGIDGDFTEAFQEYSIHVNLNHKNVAHFYEAFQGLFVCLFVCFFFCGRCFIQDLFVLFYSISYQFVLHFVSICAALLSEYVFFPPQLLTFRC
jgi:hypothetical protein